MNRDRRMMPGLTLLEVLLACAMLTALGMAAVSLMRSLSDADRDRRMLVVAPMAMAVANAAFDRRVMVRERNATDRSEQEKGTLTPPLDPIVIEVDSTPRRWVVTVRLEPMESDSASAPGQATGTPPGGNSPALVPLRFEAVPDASDWRGIPVVWWRLIPDRTAPAPEQDQ